MILVIRTDKPEAEIGVYQANEKLAYKQWHAHRALAETLHQKISTLLQSQNADWHDISGIVVYKGPGSFTGLRIGLSVANALAASYQVPIVATSGDKWISQGTSALLQGKNEQVALPEYGAPVHITQQKK